MNIAWYTVVVENNKLVKRPFGTKGRICIRKCSEAIADHVVATATVNDFIKKQQQ